jgi:hypothetical protein
MPKFNPFRPNGIVTPGMFSGRGTELLHAERALFQTKNSNPQHFIFEGERGIGKSSLFRYLDWVARGTIPTTGRQSMKFIVVNAELRDSMGHGDVVDRIMLELQREISSRDRIKELCKKAWEFVSRFEAYGIRYRQNDDMARREGLDGLTNTLADLLTDAQDEIDGVLLLIDEADKPHTSAHIGELCKLLTERLAHRGCERVSIGMAGLPGLVGKLRASHESSPRVFEVMTLEALTDTERKLVVNLGLNEAAKRNGFRTTISASALDFISSLSEGYPHFIQQFAYCAFDADNDNNIDEEDVAKGAFLEHGALDQLGRRYFSDLYIEQIGSEDYRRVLSTMADSSDSWVSRPNIIRASGVKERIVDNALRVLKDRRIIIQNERVRGEYRLPTKAFAAWIKAREAAILAAEGATTKGEAEGTLRNAKEAQGSA